VSDSITRTPPVPGVARIDPGSRGGRRHERPPPERRERPREERRDDEPGARREPPPRPSPSPPPAVPAPDAPDAPEGGAPAEEPTRGRSLDVRV
jgi:hypothetical protein